MAELLSARQRDAPDTDKTSDGISIEAYPCGNEPRCSRAVQEIGELWIEEQLGQLSSFRDAWMLVRPKEIDVNTDTETIHATLADCLGPLLKEAIDTTANGMMSNWIDEEAWNSLGNGQCNHIEPWLHRGLENINIGNTQQIQITPQQILSKFVKVYRPLLIDILFKGQSSPNVLLQTAPTDMESKESQFHRTWQSNVKEAQDNQLLLACHPLGRYGYFSIAKDIAFLYGLAAAHTPAGNMVAGGDDGSDGWIKKVPRQVIEEVTNFLNLSGIWHPVLRPSGGLATDRLVQLQTLHRLSTSVTLGPEHLVIDIAESVLLYKDHPVIRFIRCRNLTVKQPYITRAEYSSVLTLMDFWALLGNKAAFEIAFPKSAHTTRNRLQKFTNPAVSVGKHPAKVISKVLMSRARCDNADSSCSLQYSTLLPGVTGDPRIKDYIQYNPQAADADFIMEDIENLLAVRIDGIATLIDMLERPKKPDDQSLNEAQSAVKSLAPPLAAKCIAVAKRTCDEVVQPICPEAVQAQDILKEYDGGCTGGLSLEDLFIFGINRAMTILSGATTIIGPEIHAAVRFAREYFAALAVCTEMMQKNKDEIEMRTMMSPSDVMFLDFATISKRWGSPTSKTQTTGLPLQGGK
eukprot:GHVQ01008031.1.p1 GENE.GHVQ01008031.1~~GHVQ01008031.1.p1  ORF type:complete len:731 (+),score=84.71 GHVQ01008031.1:295-2193(+)